MKDNYAYLARRGQTVGEYRLTIIDSRSLMGRLIVEFGFAVFSSRQHWSALKNDPIGFGTGLALSMREKISASLRAPNRLFGAFVAVALMAVTVLLLVQKRLPEIQRSPTNAGLPVEIVTLIPSVPVNPTGSGIGAGSHGRVGMAKGLGEGSKRKTKQSHGGGSSGKWEKLPAQQGRTFQPSRIPAVLEPIPRRKNPALPEAGIDIDPKLWRDQMLAQYGDPRSSASDQSRGPGEGGNFGSGEGPGVGEGKGAGFGKGQNGNIGEGERSPGGGGVGGGFGNNPDDPDRIYRVPEVNQRAQVLTKPEPQYTEEARRAQIVGTVVLRVVFSRLGQVTNIRAVQSLPFGLTEQAILAARKIRFMPALRNGRPVSVHMQLEYNFNLY